MSRAGMNPNRHAKVSVFAPVVVGQITHLPNLEGYHAERLEVIQTSLNAMRRNAGTDCQVMVWDNGSCSILKKWLEDVYKPDYLFLSPNVGKASARSAMVRMLPADIIVGIADDDMYYYPGWLSESIRILKHFPNVGQVSGYPVRTQFRWGNRKTIQWAHNRRVLSRGRFIPEQYDMDFCTSIGRDYQYQVATTINDEDYKITWNGVEAYAVAHHCQWIGYAGKIGPFCKHDDDAMGNEVPFDIAVDNAGLLRLTTVERYTRHIGNRLDDDLIELEKSAGGML